MTTVTHREELRQNAAGTAKFVGVEHGAGVSFFWVDAPTGSGPDMHWHPYTETWVVVQGEAAITTDGTELRAGAGAVVTVPAGTRHQFRSVGAAHLEMICIHASPVIIQEFVDDGSPTQ